MMLPTRLSSSCPQCGAQPGQYCRVENSDLPRRVPHRARGVEWQPQHAPGGRGR